MWLGFGEGDARKKGEEPDQAAGTAFGFDAREELPLASGNHARKGEMGSALSEVHEGAALHVNEGFIPGGMHDLEDKSARVGSEQMEIIVVLSGEGLRNGFKTVKTEGEARGIRRSERRSNAGFRHHAENCNGGKRGWANGGGRSGRRQEAPGNGSYTPVIRNDSMRPSPALRRPRRCSPEKEKGRTQAAWARGRARKVRKSIRKQTARGMQSPARREWVLLETMPTSHGSAPPPKPAAPKKRAPIQLESSRKIAASHVTKIGY